MTREHREGTGTMETTVQKQLEALLEEIQTGAYLLRGALTHGGVLDNPAEPDVKHIQSLAEQALNLLRADVVVEEVDFTDFTDYNPYLLTGDELKRAEDNYFKRQ